jgi:molybdopterin converting factor small subunit
VQITVKLYATLREYLPESAVKHAVRIEVDSADSPQSVLDRLHVPREASHLVLLNGIYLAPGERPKPLFKEGDTLAVWPPVAGG